MTAPADASAAAAPVLQIRGAALHRPQGRGDRELWSGLDLDVRPGEFIAVLGPSGSGKTTLLRSILGLQDLSAGEIRVAGVPATRGNPRIGYIPQQRPYPPDTAMRARDVIALGLQGRRFGLPVPRRGDRERVDEMLAEVGAAHYGDRRVGALSGGEQQRLRVGQALMDRPALLLCDEPLSNLDLANQQGVTEIIDRQRRAHGAAVLFVTHDINPILGRVDRILYIAGGRFMLGTPDEVLQTRVLTDLYGAPVFVLRAGDRLIVVGVPDVEPHHDHDHEGVA
ncbi:metal ABC transporter ATP-binding protein [uncultured Microbacterium sp.]|uniref:metal ABC transporter ATP-binding protein n=1 Tax=uncultured Microbacterium sp. TaxID=191216 RepID=UPI0025FC7F65|nr:metal ABC transporter ATP-binding protein [uncultured Microbacterium sp.]MBS1900384.1 metal ABC transporter ATP-binding protein [Actinomycetota bacterium]